MVAALAAIVWANTAWSQSYFDLWKQDVTITFLTKSLHHWINDGLMAVFFLLVGLEIKRELTLGELSSARKAALPITAAVGGMVVPALFFMVFNAGQPTARGWGIPMATDIAFALGVLNLLGPRIPLSLKIFLAALAIVDDLGAVLVIALFYTSDLNLSALGGGLCVLGLLFLLNWADVRKLTPYLALGAVMWVLFLKSGVHATIAGVLLAATIPARVRINGREYVERCRSALDAFESGGGEVDSVVVSEARNTLIQEVERASEDAQMPLERLEHALHPFVTFVIVPIFAFANAGVPLMEGLRGAVQSGLGYGIALGLALGKPVGILLASWIAVKAKKAELPSGVGWRHILGAGLLAGIGFTMSLFIAELGLPNVEMLTIAKSSILVASLVAGIAGFASLKGIARRRGNRAAA
jgi:NhaA family Na+:H+ antiporter